MDVVMVSASDRPPSHAELIAAGRAARDRVPIADHAGWRPSANRLDPIQLIADQAATRIPELVPVRHGRMMRTAATFYRGAALPMAADLSLVPNTGITTQLGGDAHLANFGLFASPERDLLFDINDFDETLPGPFEWDVKRLAASLVVAARDRAFPEHSAKRAARHAVRSYRTRMLEFASLGALAVYYSRVDVADIMEFVDKRARPYLADTAKAARHHDALAEAAKLTVVDDGRRRLVDRPPTMYHDAEPLAALTALDCLAAYRTTLTEDRRLLLDRFDYADAAIKVVGVGSVGLAAVVVLMLDGGGEPLFMQVKEAQPSVLERFLGASSLATPAERVVAGQRRLQAASDVMLGWSTGRRGRSVYVRQLRDQKGSAVLDAMTEDDLASWGELCGWALARGHARSGEPAAIAAYLGDDDAFDHAVADFAVVYADQTEADHQAFLAAIQAGQLAAEPGV